MIVRKSVSSQYDDIKQKKFFAEYIKIYAMLTLAGTLMALGIYVFVLPCPLWLGA